MYKSSTKSRAIQVPHLVQSQVQFETKSDPLQSVLVCPRVSVVLLRRQDVTPSYLVLPADSGGQVLGQEKEVWGKVVV